MTSTYGLSATELTGLIGVLAFAMAFVCVLFWLIEGKSRAVCSLTAAAAGAGLGTAFVTFNLVVGLISAMVLVVSLGCLMRKVIRQRTRRRHVDHWIETKLMSQHYSSR